MKTKTNMDIKTNMKKIMTANMNIKMKVNKVLEMGMRCC
jgi:hypothetical protein